MGVIGIELIIADDLQHAGYLRFRTTSLMVTSGMIVRSRLLVPYEIDAKCGDHFLQADFPVLIGGISARASTYPLRGFRTAAQGKFVTLGVTRGCIAVASPVSAIT